MYYKERGYRQGTSAIYSGSASNTLGICSLSFCLCYSQTQPPKKR